MSHATSHTTQPNTSGKPLLYDLIDDDGDIIETRFTNGRGLDTSLRSMYPSTHQRWDPMMHNVGSGIWAPSLMGGGVIHDDIHVHPDNSAANIGTHGDEQHSDDDDMPPLENAAQFIQRG